MSRIAIVTGATGGIGQKFIDRINEYDDIDVIWAVGRNSERLKSVAEKYGKVVPVESDLEKGLCILVQEKS